MLACMLKKSERIQFVGHHGLLLSGILELPAAEPKGWLLFSHCFTCNKDLKAIVRISRGLSELGWGILRYDFAGLGGSEGNFSETNFTTNCEDLRRAAEYLSAQYHAPRFLIGHSFGGAASLAMADSLPSVVGVIGVAAPSDTIHLAELLISMAPSIATEGQGIVSIGGQSFTIHQQMIEDFRQQRLRDRVRSLQKPVLIFHSPEDETVAFEHALINSGYRSETHARGHQPDGLSQRTLVALPGSNHLLTSSDRDIPMIVRIIHAWCDRLI
jgi:putative redox protein